MFFPSYLHWYFKHCTHLEIFIIYSIWLVLLLHFLTFLFFFCNIAMQASLVLLHGRVASLLTGRIQKFHTMQMMRTGIVKSTVEGVSENFTMCKQAQMTVELVSFLEDQLYQLTIRFCSFALWLSKLSNWFKTISFIKSSGQANGLNSCHL